MEQSYKHFLNQHQSYKKVLMLLFVAMASILPSAAQSPLNEEEIYNRIMQRKDMDGYREGTPWDNTHIYYNTVEYNGAPAGAYKGKGCFGFMLDMMEYASNYEYPIRVIQGTYDNLPEIHIGDGVRINNGGHSVVVIGKSEDGHVVTVVEGNYNYSVHWGRVIDLADPNVGFTYLATFWPEVTYAMGDVNHDGSVSVTDVLLVVEYVLGKNPEKFFIENADINSDKEISTADVLSIVAIIMGETE